MSIIKKITLLFVISLLLIGIIGFWIDSINGKRIDTLIKEKYFTQAYTILLNIDNDTYVKELIKEAQLQILQEEITTPFETLYEHAYPSGHVKIIQEHLEDEFIIIIDYKDKQILLKTYDEENITEKFALNILISLDIFILIFTFLYLIKLLQPLKKITATITNFSKGDLSVRSDNNSKDEIGILSQSFNTMAQNIQNLIQTREELLQSIAHELRTPITKGKFIVEKLDNFHHKDTIKKIFNDLEYLTNALLELEKLHTQQLTTTNFNVETLIIQALNRLYIEEETQVSIDIGEHFDIQGDLEYLTVALKNLIDNAMKYAIQKPIFIETTSHCIIIKNYGEPLSQNLTYYTKPFTQEKKNNIGFGLGLSLVDKILQKHNFNFTYEFQNGMNCFAIHTAS